MSYLTNPYRFGSGFDLTDLKAYYTFDNNPATGNLS